MSNPFQFKQFTIQQSNAPFKVGTDAVLLGAWTRIPADCEKIIDVGSGTGIIALMLAQRCNADILAIEKNTEAYADLRFNVEESMFSDRIFACFGDFFKLKSLAGNIGLLVCNPPFFGSGPLNPDAAKAEARHDQTFSFDTFFENAFQLLTLNGKVAMIFPKLRQAELTTIASRHGFNPTRVCTVRPVSAKPAHRVLVEFEKHISSPIQEEELIIETARHQYTSEFQRLTQDFYL